MMRRLMPGLLGTVICLVIWQCLSRLGLFNPIYFTSPYEVIQEAWVMVGEQSIWYDTIHTLYRIVVSIALSALIGIPLGILIGYFSGMYRYLAAVLDFLRSIPPIILYPLLLITAGTGDLARIGVAVFGSVIVLILIVSEGLLQTSQLRQQYFLSQGASIVQILKQVIWYQALPHVMTAMRTITSLCVIIIIVTEMLVGARYGLGTRVQNVQITSNIPDLFVTIIVIGCLGVIFNKGLIWIEKKVVFWKRDQ